MLTQCPHCTASFRVSDAQLQAAHGKVRCGACMEVFNASDHLSVDNKPKVQGEGKTADTAGEDMFAGLDHDDDFEELASAQPADSNSAINDKDSHNLTTGGSVLSDQAADDSDHDFSETFKELAATDSGSQSFRAKTDTGLGQHDHGTGAQTDLSFRTLTDASSAQGADGQQSDEPISTASPLLEKPVNQITALRAEPVSIRPTLRVDRSAEWLRRIAWIAGILAITAFIVLQLAWFQFDYLARQSYLRPVYSHACQLFGCKLPSPYNIEQIRSQNLVVRNHPLENKALIIDAIVINQASFEQPFPDIEFTFSDLNNNVIARRVFAPGEYLSGDARGKQVMPTNAPVHIALEILDPGKEAVNYTMRFVQNKAYLGAD